ncbi:MAG: ankyrin repeat domain-containing protein [Alphaproteobacteria bacterium]|nr:ankyrin repeat domain-containing protein [Alphaproteobacteria bacterium]
MDLEKLICDGTMNELKAFVAKGLTNIKGDEGWTALAYAAFHGDMQKVDFLLKNGANPNAQDDYGYTPLMQTVEGNHAKIAQRLLDAGADPKLRNDLGWRAETCACVLCAEAVRQTLRCHRKQQVYWEEMPRRQRKVISSFNRRKIYLKDYDGRQY